MAAPNAAGMGNGKSPAMQSPGGGGDSGDEFGDADLDDLLAD